MAARPAGLGEGVAADDRAEVVDQDLREPRLDRGDGGVSGSVPDDAVLVDLREAAAGGRRPPAQALDAGPEILLGRRHPDPVLELVDNQRRIGILVDEEETRELGVSQLGEPGRLGWPSNQRDVHGGNAARPRFHECFADVNPQDRDGETAPEHHSHRMRRPSDERGIFWAP